jgi:Alpha-galactosidase
MGEWIRIEENGLHLLFEITESGDVRFLHMGLAPAGTDAENWTDKKRGKYRLVEVHVSGENHDDHHGSKHTGTLPGKRLKLVKLEDLAAGEHGGETGRRLVFHQVDTVTGLKVRSILQFYNGLQVIRTWTEVQNDGLEPAGLEYVSSFALTGIDSGGLGTREAKLRLSIPHNTWYGEAQWQTYTLPELGLHTVNEFSMKRLSYGSTGTWSSSQYAPMGYLANVETGTGLVWQIEHNGSWHWEISDMADQLYLHLSGPTDAEHDWWKNLEPGETFVSVPVCAGVVQGGLQEAARLMTEYRRRIRRLNEDNVKLPVIFNDYMNCLFGDPTTEKLLPLIDAAAAAGCEIYCIDCGWYSDGEWWDGVGEWLPSAARLPGGIEEVLQYIRSKGMVPGLWLEIEVMGIACPLASKLPDDWFFMRHGKRVIDHARYQLDFRNPAVRAYADQVIDRIAGDYGARYIKMDYNINAGIGTECGADSFGDGLLEHNRAYLGWIDSIFARYPDLIIENCGSGGMRLDYALLSRLSIQSSSDQTDYRKNGVIAAASASLVTPEQCAVWSYPLRDGSREEVIFNMVNSLLLRIHQSGHLAEISPERFDLVAEGIAAYRQYRERLSTGLPIWPLGLPGFGSGWMAYGSEDNEGLLLAVWRVEDENSVCVLPLEESWKDTDASVELLYPSEGPAEWSWNRENGSLSVKLAERNTARLFEIRRRMI